MATKVVILGGGFAGLNAAKELGRLPGYDVLVVDRQNHHLFQPLLYQVAMAALSPADIAVPIRSILAGYPSVRVLKAVAEGIDTDHRIVTTDAGAHPYDWLVVACGSQHMYFGHDEWEAVAPGLKTLPQATEIRRRVLEAFEGAERETDPERRRQLLTFVIVGGGPTGVELAGAIGEMSRYTLARDFRSIDPRQTRVVLVEAGPRILPGFSEKMAARAARDLESLGAQVWTGAKVTNVTGTCVEIGGEKLYTATVLWAAGVRAADIGKSLGVERDGSGRVRVQADLSIADHPEVFVAGDLAHCSAPGGRPLPGVAQVAIQQGVHIAHIIRSQGKERPPFLYKDKGQMATIGRSRAVAEVFGLEFAGRLAWWAWLLLHVYSLTGFRNRVSVLVQWAWSYFTFGRGARLIVDKEWQFYGPD